MVEYGGLSNESAVSGAGGVSDLSKMSRVRQVGLTVCFCGYKLVFLVAGIRHGWAERAG